MKRFLSMFLTLALVLTTLVIPVAAEEEAVTAVAVDITSIADGATIAAGTNLTLAADASGVAEVKNIDFYANGAKLPGTIVGNKGDFIWYDISEGVYEITTQVTYNGGATAPGNESVSIRVVPADESKIKLLWPNGESFTSRHGGGSAQLSTDYAMFGDNSIKIVPKGNYPGVTFDMSDKNIERTWGQLAFVIYSPEEVSGLSIRRSGGTPNSTYGTGQQMVYNEFFRMPKDDSDLVVHPGYNVYVTDSASYTGGKIDTNGDGIEDTYPNVHDTDGDGVADLPNQNTYLDFIRLTLSAPNDNTLPVYLVGIYGITGSIAAPVATPDIPNGATNICNALDTYRINFDAPIYPNAEKAPAKVTYDVEGVATEVEGVTYTYGTDYVDLHFSEPFANTTTYTVSIPEGTIPSYYTDSYYKAGQCVAATSFTFTTKDDICGSATPVVKMSYPPAGATATANTSFAAQIVAPNSTLSTVKFYKGEEEIAGTVTAMTDGEYWFDPTNDALTADKETTITVKMFDGEGNQLGEAASATYTGATTPEYDVKGIYNGKVFVTDEQPSMNIHVVDKANKSKIFTESGLATSATKVSKVEFYGDNNALVATDTVAPYTYDLTFADTGAHSLQVKVYDVYGNIHDDFVYSYTVVDGSKNPISIEDDFDDYDAATVTKDELVTKFFGSTSNLNSQLGVSIATVNGSQALKIETASDASGWKYAALKAAKKNTGYKVHYYEFDFANSGAYKSSVLVREGYQAGKQHSLFATNKNFYTNATTNGTFSGLTAVHKVGVVLDYNPTTPVATIYIDGQEWNRVEMTELTTDYNLLQFGFNNASAVVVLDNFKYAVYDATPEYAVKGIYEGATMVKEEEATRTITVVDKAKANVVSTTATAVSKVELLKDGVVVAASTEEIPNVCALPNDSYGTFELEVRVTDIYGEAHSFVYNYNVVEGVKDADSIVENFDGLAEETDQEKLQASIASRYNSDILFTPSNGAMGIYGNGGWKNHTFKSSDSVTGRKVHYYEFDITSGGHGPKFNVNGTEIFITKTNPTTNESATTWFNNNKPTMTVIVDDTLATPVATVLVDGQEWKRVEVAKSETGISFVVNVGASYGVVIDNFKYTVYNYPARYGFGEFEDTVGFDTTGPQRFTTYFTNTTDADITVKYFVVTYEADGRQHFVYNADSRLKNDEDGLTTSWTVTYPAGSVDAANTFKLNIGEAGEDWAARIYGFVVDTEGEFDIAPIGQFE